jgi:outer membrane receptor for ferrienterochelin and colicins
MSDKLLAAASACAMMLTAATPAFAQRVAVRGIVTDSATGAPLPHVRAEWRDHATRRTAATFTDAAGTFMIKLRPSQYEILLTRIGYASTRVGDATVTQAGPSFGFALPARGVPLDPVVVTVSRSEQALLDAPAAVSVISRDAIDTDIRLDALDQIRTLPGVDFASKGLIQNTYSARGPRTPSARALLMLTDHRYTEVPAVLSVSFLRSTTREDIERIEVLRGPAAALYGPGAPQGVVHIITRSPFESSGGVVAVSVGGHSVLQGTTRYAAVMHPRLAMSISADYLQGDDWESIDEAETENRVAAIARGADPDTLLIGIRDYAIRRVSGETRIDWRMSPRTEVMTKAGFAEAGNAVDHTGLGAVQLRDWRSWYLQSRLQHGGLMLNAALGANDAGDTYYLRTGAPLVEESRMFAVQLQHKSKWRSVDMVYGSDLRAIDPRTGGTVHGYYEDDDFIRETGAYVQATAALSSRLQLVSALRVDHHNRMEDVVFSPRTALIYKPAPTHAVRLTYNRAFHSPYPNELFLDTRVNTLTGFPYEVRQHRAPLNGYTFARDCAGLCMHSPYSTAGPGTRLPADATVLWAEMVQLLAMRGVDIGDIPAPPAAAVGTALAVRNQGARTWEPITPEDVRDSPPLQWQITNALELGYRGTLGTAITVTADVHATRVHNRYLGSATAITPNVFFDRASLEQYMVNYRSPEAAAVAAAALAQIPVGIITPVESPYATDILLVGRQGESHLLWGLDVTAQVPLNSRISIFGTYSGVSFDTVSSFQPDVPINLSIPLHKGALEATYRNASATLFSSVRLRAVAAYRRRGLFKDPTADGFEVMDLAMTYRVPPSRRISISAELRNTFDQVARESPGGASIGRLGLVRARVEF